MDIVRVTRAQYRQRNDAHYLQQLQSQYSPCLIIPEGGANADGVRGCIAIADLLLEALPGSRHVVVPVGTGATMAGLAAGLGSTCKVTGIAALKGATDLSERVTQLLAECQTGGNVAQWHILHHYHCGGFARDNADLRQFILAFESVHGVALEPVYTGKMLFAIYQLLASGAWPVDKPLMAVHTGGLQGRRGYAWLDPGRAHED